MTILIPLLQGRTYQTLNMNVRTPIDDVTMNYRNALYRDCRRTYADNIKGQMEYIMELYMSTNCVTDRTYGDLAGYAC